MKHTLLSIILLILALQEPVSADVNPITDLKVNTSLNMINLQWKIRETDPEITFVILRRDSASSPFIIVGEVNPSAAPWNNTEYFFSYSDKPPQCGYWQYQILARRNGEVIGKRSLICNLKNNVYQKNKVSVPNKATSEAGSNLNLFPPAYKIQENWAEGIMKFNYCILKSDQGTLKMLSESDAPFEKNMSEDFGIFQPSKTITLKK